MGLATTIGIGGRTVTVKIKYADFEQITRSRTLSHPIASRGELAEAAEALLASTFPPRRAIRLLGISMSGFQCAGPKHRPQMVLGF